MRKLAAFSLALATVIGAASAEAAISPQQAASRIKAAALRSSKVIDKTAPFRAKLGPVKAGSSVRTFSLSNIRTMTRPVNGPGGTLTAVRVHGGGRAVGTINLRTEKVRFTGYMMPR